MLPIIFKFLNKNYWDTMVIMVQKELGDRIVAQPNSKNYSRISIMSQTFCKVEKQFDICTNSCDWRLVDFANSCGLMRTGRICFIVPFAGLQVRLD